jgi:hypothetical protein
MSVLKSQRKESSIKFLDTAYDLELHTLKCCMKLPKRYTFFYWDGAEPLGQRGA